MALGTAIGVGLPIIASGLGKLIDFSSKVYAAKKRIQQANNPNNS